MTRPSTLLSADASAALRLAEAGAREAAHAVARLLKRQKIPVTSVVEAPLSDLVTRHGPRALVVAFTVSGAWPGRFAVVTNDASARTFAGDLIGGIKSETGLPKRAMGALTELGNIAASAYLNGVAELLANATCVPSVPTCAIDDAHTLMTSAFAGPNGVAPERIIVATLTVDTMTLDLAFAG